ncbi:MAG: hypothetical protein U0271_16055 [Polyangiaceae bacterium]
MNAKELQSCLETSTAEQRRQLLYSLQSPLDEATFDVVRGVAVDPTEYDLCRIEAIKLVGLSGVQVRDLRRRASDVLLHLAVTDKDSDVQNYSLQQLAFYTDELSLPGAVAPLIDGQDDMLVSEGAFAVVCSQTTNPETETILKSLVNHHRFGARAKRRLSGQ